MVCYTATYDGKASTKGEYVTDRYRPTSPVLSVLDLPNTTNCIPTFCYPLHGNTYASYILSRFFRLKFIFCYLISVPFNFVTLKIVLGLCL